MAVITLSNGMECLIDDEDYDQVSQFNWHVRGGTERSRSLYAQRNVWEPATKRRRTQKMHRFILSAPNGVLVDHVNGDGLDNRRANLRLCSFSQNLANAVKRRNTTSSFKGVCKPSSRDVWMGYCTFNGKNIFLGHFKSEIEAAIAYNVAAKKYYGDFAKLNEITQVHNKEINSEH